MKQSFEDVVYLKFSHLKGYILSPIVKLLAFLRVTPYMLSYAGVLSMILFIYYIGTEPRISFYCLIFCLLMDGLDGSLARYLKTDSDKGKFTDVLMDNLNFTLFIFGLTAAGLLTGLIAAVLVYFMLLTKVLMIVKKNIFKESDWLIKAKVGAFANIFVYVFYGFFVLWAFGGPDLFELLALISSALLILKAVIDYLIIKTTLFQK